MTTATNQLKIALAQPRFRAAISAHAKQNPEQDPVRRVHQAVGSIAPQLAVVAAHHAMAARDEKKVSKSSVAYRPGDAARHCGNCSMYSEGSCTLVRGVIDPSATCNKWEAQKGGKPTAVPANHPILKQARQAPDGHHYVPDPQRPGKFARVVQGSSGVEQSAVNRQVAGSSPAPGANMREVDLIRHGETDMNEGSSGNSVDKIRGHHDIPLNQAGKTQALKTGQQLARSNSKPNVLVSSDLCRAKLTASIISKAANIPISWVTEHFRPWDAGNLTGQPSEKAVPVMARYAEQAPDTPIPGGESFHTFLGRLFIGIDEAFRRHPTGKIGIVSHHRDERALHSWRAKGYPEDGSIDLKTFNEKGEKTGAAQTMQLPVDRVRMVAQRYRSQAAQEPPAQQQVSDDHPGQE